MTTTGPIFVAGLEDTLIREARAAAEIAASATTSREEGAKSITAIILAVAAIEARLGIWTAIFREEYRIDDTTLRKWRGWGPPDIVKDIFSRLKPPKSVGELLSFQRLSAIVELRNHVAHYFPEFRVPGTWPDRLEPYIKNHTLAPAGDDTMDWTSRLIAGSVAVQVVQYAEQFMNEFMKLAWRRAA